jgi:hypothetical protein
MGNNTANRPLRKRRHLATRSSLDSAEMAIVDGRRTIGEISAMVEMEVGKGGPFDDPFPDDVLEVAQPAPLTIGAECRAMFGMSLGPLNGVHWLLRKHCRRDLGLHAGWHATATKCHRNHWFSVLARFLSPTKSPRRGLCFLLLPHAAIAKIGRDSVRATQRNELPLALCHGYAAATAKLAIGPLIFIVSGI